jgi:hypothetical protein
MLTPDRLSLPVLFLDFDGVLHQAGEPTIDGNGEFVPNERLFCWRTHLENLLQSHPNVQIVISSDWRKYHSEEDLATFLGKELGRRLVGVMPILENGSRAEAVREEATRLHLRHWIALDDHRSVHDARQNGDGHFVSCPPEQGLGDGDTRDDLASTLRWTSWLAQHNCVSIQPIYRSDLHQR